MSQNDKIIERLKESPGRWVPMPELVNASGSYNIHSRITEIRKRGITVENKVECDEMGGKKHSFYRIP